MVILYNFWVNLQKKGAFLWYVITYIGILDITEVYF